MKEISLLQHATVLDDEALKRVHSALTDAGLLKVFNNKYRKVFKKLRNEAKGREKKIYAAFCHSSPDEVERMISALLSEFKLESK